MEAELLSVLRGGKKQCWHMLLTQNNLEPDEDVEAVVLLWEGERLIATGSRKGNLLKCIAVAPDSQGQDLTAALLTHLRQDAFAHGHRHLFLYTKPKNRWMFSSLFFYPVAQTEDVLLMENRQNGIGTFLDSLDAPCREGNVGAAVMNCNPFTLGHKYLIETAARECDWVYIFVLSEDASLFPAGDRLELVRQGTKDLPNVTVLPTGPYLISSATFPTYFLKERDRAGEIHCLLDLEIFLNHFVPRFGIRCRYVGTEPLSPLTDRYNQVLLERLPPRGVRVREIPRLERQGISVSASAVRALLGTNQPEAVAALVPEATFLYLKNHNLL